jgi:diguanylate cyclase (GGDEF)-like protein/PAS domain S-box-containing protein
MKKANPSINSHPPDLHKGGQALRRRAEEKLGEKKQMAPSATYADTQCLIHELQVHQIELEMQNEELAQARLELEVLLRQYTDLYNFAPVGYFTLLRDGEILQANLAGAHLFGVEVGKLIKRRFGVFLPAQSRAVFNEFLENVFASESKEACEIAILKDGSDPLSLHIEAISDVPCGQTQACHAVVIDITARKQTEERLRYLSTHDTLTGLYARGFFMEEIARIERGREFPVSIVMADVDRLKETNDRAGHAAGDDLLKNIAQILTAAFRAEDVIARIGGDEFAVLLPKTDATAANVSLQRVRKMIQQNNAANPGTPIRLSLGVSTAGTPVPISDLLDEADANMYGEKRGDHDA